MFGQCPFESWPDRTGGKSGLEYRKNIHMAAPEILARRYDLRAPGRFFLTQGIWEGRLLIHVLAVFALPLR